MPTFDIKCQNASINKEMFFDIPIKNKSEVCGKIIKMSKIMIIQLVTCWILSAF